MTAYVVADVKWHDLEKQKEYSSGFPPILAKYVGRSLRVGGSEPRALEGSWQPHHIVIMEFPTMTAVRRW